MKGQNVLFAGMGEIRTSRDHSAVLACLGLGSCVAVCAYDPTSRVGGIAHVVLPDSRGQGKNSPGKYADTAIPLLLNELAKLGGRRSRLVVKLAGGARLGLAPALDSVFTTGSDNVAALKAALTRERIPVSAMDVGGSIGRTVRIFLDTGSVTVKSIGHEARELL